MNETTALDRAHAAMEASPDDDAARLRFFARLCDNELFLMLAAEPAGDSVSPEIFDLAAGRFVLVFDREERLSRFAGRAVPYAAMSGRVLVGMLSGRDLGMAVNLEVAPSSILLGPEAVTWLETILAQGPARVEAQIAAVSPPAGLPEALLHALDAKLALMAGRARRAYLVGTTDEAGRRGHMLAIIDAQKGAETALAQALNEALVFSGLKAGALDVAFLAGGDPLVERLAAQGLRIDLPEPPQDGHDKSPAAPGRDPARPPILR
ncbi:SseB family protein [Pontibaca methylaminivorans]|uniref:SseB protein N-terminal domain-containing protein n=1 Tax=Pontibaca methylaminivorans TaxID=515897 RepID=A0A1R3WQ79_9RHOB|nr:SseB family protein [Pontibaca methylaminivorans]SIT80045.1 SseB protein N-terminal domain-containing protein [Pontibaca methylaminivorans]